MTTRQKVLEKIKSHEDDVKDLSMRRERVKYWILRDINLPAGEPVNSLCNHASDYQNLSEMMWRTYFEIRQLKSMLGEDDTATQ